MTEGHGDPGRPTIEEDGSIALDRVQPEVGTSDNCHSYADLDNPTKFRTITAVDITWNWYVSKVSEPDAGTLTPTGLYATRERKR